MAVIVCNTFVGISTKVHAGVDYSQNANNFVAYEVSPPFTPTEINTGYGSIQSNLPIAEACENFVAVRARSYLDDYYNRIHIIPKKIDLGNLLSVQTENISVWNAYLDAQLLSDIVAENTDGLEMVEPTLTPTSFAALELRNYVLNISTSGSPVIDALYTFNFESESPTLEVIGRRVVIWHYKPKYPFKERFEWKTDIITSFKGEQRIRLRDSGRQGIAFTSVISSTDYTKAKALAFQWVHRVFGVPVWIDMRLVGTINAGAMSINVDTTNADFRADDIILIWSSNDSFEALETTNISASLIDLKSPVINSYSNAYAIPIRYANALNGLTFSRDADLLIQVEGDFTVKNNVNLSASIGLPTYKGKQVFIDTVLSSEASTDRYTRSIDVFDNGSGPIDVDIKADWTSIVTKVSLNAFGSESVWRYKNFLHSLYGRQKTFFIPSWHDDFHIIDDIGSTAASIRIQNIGFDLYYSNQFIFIELVGGTYYFGKITGSNVDVDNSEVLTLEESFGVQILVSSIKRAGILKHVRLDTDKIDMNYSVALEMNVSFPVKEVPYVV